MQTADKHGDQCLPSLCCSRTDKCVMVTHTHTHFCRFFHQLCTVCFSVCVFVRSPATFNTFCSPKIDGVFASSLRLHMYECIHALQVTLRCMCNGNALKLVTPGYESVNQRACVSAEDCRTEVLTLQQQRWGCGGGGGRNKERE